MDDYEQANIVMPMLISEACGDCNIGKGFSGVFIIHVSHWPCWSPTKYACVSVYIVSVLVQLAGQVNRCNALVIKYNVCAKVNPVTCIWNLIVMLRLITDARCLTV